MTAWNKAWCTRQDCVQYIIPETSTLCNNQALLLNTLYIIHGYNIASLLAVMLLPVTPSGTPMGTVYYFLLKKNCFYCSAQKIITSYC